MNALWAICFMRWDLIFHRLAGVHGSVSQSATFRPPTFESSELLIKMQIPRPCACWMGTSGDVARGYELSQASRWFSDILILQINTWDPWVQVLQYSELPQLETCLTFNQSPTSRSLVNAIYARHCSSTCLWDWKSVHFTLLQFPSFSIWSPPSGRERLGGISACSLAVEVARAGRQGALLLLVAA